MRIFTFKIDAHMNEEDYVYNIDVVAYNQQDAKNEIIKVYQAFPGFKLETLKFVEKRDFLPPCIVSVHQQGE